MPLVQCPECQKEVSSEALSCPQCAFPHPGKKERLNGRASENLLTCQDCGNFISKHAPACPHCGAPNGRLRVTEENSGESSIKLEASTLSESLEEIEQTWLCPNCGVPYTRRRKGANGNVGLSGPESSHTSGAKLPTVNSSRLSVQEEKSAGLEGRSSFETYVPRKERKRSPLWEEAKAMYEEEHQFPRPQKKLNPFYLVLFAVLILSLLVFAFLGFKGLNPLEALVYWQM